MLSVEDWAEIRRLYRGRGCRLRRSPGCWGIEEHRQGRVGLRWAAEISTAAEGFDR